jgi:hypothetical protein
MFSSPRPFIGRRERHYFFRLQHGASGPHHERVSIPRPTPTFFYLGAPKPHVFAGSHHGHAVKKIGEPWASPITRISERGSPPATATVDYKAPTARAFRVFLLLWGGGGGGGCRGTRQRGHRKKPRALILILPANAALDVTHPLRVAFARRCP